MTRRAALAVFAFPALIMAAVAAYGATSRGTWQNEYVAWYAIRLNLGDEIRLMGVIDAVKAGYFLPMHLWTNVVGDSALAMRLPSIAAMAIAAGATALIGRSLFNAAVGVAAGVLFALVPAMSRYGQEIQPYAWTAAGVTVSTLLLLRALNRPTRLAWLAYTAAVVFTGWTHVVALSILGVHFLLYVRVARRDDRAVAGWPVAALLTACAVTPVAVWGSRQSGSISWIKAGPQQLRTMPGDLFMSGPVAYTVYGLAAVGVLTALIARCNRYTVCALLAWAILPPLFGFATFPWLHMFLPRYFLFTVPAWLLLAASALTALPARGRATTGLRIGLALAAAAFLALVGAPAQGQVRAAPVAGRPDLRGPALAVMRQQQPGDGIAYGGQASVSYIRQAVAYETRGHSMPADAFLLVPGRNLGWYLSKECADPDPCALPYQRIWLITTATPKDPTSELYKPKATVLRTEFTIASVQQFNGSRLVLLTRKPAPARGDRS